MKAVFVRAAGRRLHQRIAFVTYDERLAEFARARGTEAADLFTNVLARLDDADWERTVTYTYPNRAERSLRWVATHTLHEVRHHLLDVRRQQPGDSTTGDRAAG